MNQQINFKDNDVSYINSKKISCDGGNSSSKHPLIYLNMGNNDYAICPYCSKKFSLINSNKSSNSFNKNNKK